MTAVTGLLTAEQFRLIPESGRPRELVRGKVVEMSVPAPKHGYYRSNISGVLRDHVKPRKLGRVMANDSGVITERGPDTVRGGGRRLLQPRASPTRPASRGLSRVVPEIIFEVRSPTDRGSRINTKVGEYLASGVLYVCVLDPGKEALMVYRDDELTFPDLLPEFRARIAEFLD